MTDRQISLFSTAELPGRYLSQEPTLEISQEALQSWKQRVWQYQQEIRRQPSLQQGSLFGTEPSAADIAEEIDPFRLPQQNIEFWRWKAPDAGVAALYFVIDHELPIVLYVGETIKANQRWKGEHDCKRYVLNYVSAHRSYQLPVTVNIGFWQQAPTATRSRQTLETALIDKWRSPFNKENWEFWGTPFVGGKA